MTVTDKTPLLVIGKSAKPGCFKGARLPSGVIYRSNTKAWMTAKLSEEYMRLIDCRFAAKNRRVVIILDNALAHVALDNLTAVKLAFLPPNTTAIAQPLDQGIIRAVKQLYKKNLLRRFLLAIECGKLFSIDLIGAIHLLEYSWRQVEATTVQNCFKRAGFSVCAGDADDTSDTIDQTSDIVDEACKTLLAEVLERQGVTEGISFPDFRDTDSDVQTSPDMSDEAIVASVVEVSPNDIESDNTGDPGPTVAEAAHCVSVMRVFAEKRGLVEKLAHSISEFEAAVVAARPPRRQMKITDFIRRS
ncbi:hypothetical protein HPB51_023016 [Rhipicephalus microplus]|uniref:DDE-1 domain-containing protein n=1 Tax=Rhipicephalus microplus TaxID=6941 RepID=A0A9J6D7C6_RHIMP|nr:hypothetical protein HPB51_023016 [Rhipicephalus microplus]